MASRTQVPVAPDLFTWPSADPRLLGSRCGVCGLMTFPHQDDCPRCFNDEMARAEFARTGTLWTFTTQEFPPKAPPYGRTETLESFRPYAVGYVEFEGQARVEGRIECGDFSELRIGMEMVVVIVPLFPDEADGDEIMTYAFQPVRED